MRELKEEYKRLEKAMDDLTIGVRILNGTSNAQRGRLGGAPAGCHASCSGLEHGKRGRTGQGDVGE